jgi:DNA-binding NarL/FixJ family response regulator
LEEHPLLRHGSIDYLNSQPDMTVCGEADNIRHARDKIAECKPQLLLTALRLGTGDSLEFIKALKAEEPGLLILVYSAFEEAIFAERTLRAGADGYVMKSPQSHLRRAQEALCDMRLIRRNEPVMETPDLFVAVAAPSAFGERPFGLATNHSSSA